MKLIEKRCPNCGAGLSFDENDKNVHCEYCNMNYEVKRDDTKMDNPDDAYDLVKMKKVASTIFTFFAFSSIIPFIVFLFIFGIVVFMLIMGIGNIMESRENMNNDFFDTNPIVEPKKDKYVTEISQIDEKSLEIFHKETKNTLDKWTGKIWSDVSETEWTYVGMYLLVNKDEKKEFGEVNILYDAYKKTYTGEYNMDVYGVVAYTNLKLLEDDTVNNSYYGTPYVPMKFINGGTSSFIYGYEGNEDLYNKLIRTKRDEYKILATDGLYLEN